MYVCTSSCIFKSVCNLYIIEKEGEKEIVLDWLHGNDSIVCSIVLFVFFSLSD